MRDGGMQAPPLAVKAPPSVPASLVGPFGVSGFSPAPSKKSTLVTRSKATTPVKAPAPRQSTPAPKKSSGSVGSSRSGSIMPSAPAPTTPPPAGPPSIDEFLAGDSAYKSQSDAFAKAWADYQNQAKLQTDQYGIQYDTNTKQLAQDQTEASTNLNDDYASRGLLNSGVFAKAFSDLQNQYADKQKGLDTAKSDFLANLASAQGNFQSDQDLQNQKAKQDAINRRAAQYGV
jgi:hypothetical protein